MEEWIPGSRQEARPGMTEALASKSLQVGIQCLAFVELDAKTVEQHRDLRVLADREHDVHALLVVEMLRQLRPDRFGDELFAMQVVSGAQQCCVGRAPARRVGAAL